MTPFPPIFAYVIFGLLDLIALAIDLTGILAILGVFISFLTTILYIIWVFFRYGPSKATEKLFSLKNKVGKKAMKLLGGSVIPFVNVWAVYDDYKQEVKEAKNKELGIVEDESQNSGGGFLKKLVMSAAVISTGGLSAAGEAAVSSGAATIEGPTTPAESGTAQASNKVINGKVVEGNFGSNITKGLANKKDKKTIEEEVGGVKTGLNREDYDADIKNYGNFDTYTKENKEKEEEKVKQEEEKKKIAESKRIQGLKVEKDLREEMLDRSKRRFGESSDQVKRLEEESGGENYKDEYREAA